MRSRESLGVVLVLMLAAGCSGGKGHWTTTTAPPNPKATAEAARSCRMWSEVIARFAATQNAPDYATLDAMAAAIVPVANQASSDDSRWSQLALDLAGANDFKSAALPDVNQRITADCKAVPPAAVKAAAAEPHPFTSTSAPASTTAATAAPLPSTSGP